MAAVFLAFAAADVLPLRQFGVGLTIAVVLDATIVRLVLLPAIMRAFGPRVWWLPAWLDRRLPNVERGANEAPMAGSLTARAQSLV
jgi:RND superfamily putative drug exporter